MTGKLSLATLLFAVAMLLTACREEDKKITTGMFENLNAPYDLFYQTERMTQAEREQYRIDDITSEFISPRTDNSELAAGKIIRQDEKGALKTFLYVMDDHMTSEFLASYAPDGSIVDCLLIAQVSAYGGDRGYGEIDGDKITVHSWYPVMEEGEPELEYLADYTIEPNLTFTLAKEYTRVPQF